MEYQGNKPRVILVTDGDRIARKAVEQAVTNIGGRTISASAGNPTPLTGERLVELIKRAKHDPVVVMVDDRGSCHKGKGEKVLQYVANHPDLEIMGVLAVASNTDMIDGVPVDYAVTKRKEIIEGQVDKSGEQVSGEKIILGDTVDVLNELQERIPIIVGIGDIGKMDGMDNPLKGAQITSKALNLIIEHWKGINMEIYVQSDLNEEEGL